MPNSFNDWNRNRRGSAEDWDDDYNRSNYSRNRNYRNDYDENNYGNSGNTGNYGYGQSRGNYGGRYGDTYSDRNLNGDDYNRNSDVYGSPNRDNDYSNTGDSDWNMNRGYNDYKYGNNYNRNRNDNNRDWWDKTKDEVSSWFGDDAAQRRRRRDNMNEGNYRGKGPKGYTRSDERIREDVNDKLSDDAHIDASDIDVTVSDCEVTLSGTVNNRWEKRHAEDIIESVSGVRNVENRLKIRSNYNTGSNSDITSGNYGSGTMNR